MAELDEGASLPDLNVTPDRYLTVRYAGASGDFNPIHIDEDFAKQVGLPGRILHGLYTMAQVARAQTEAAGGPEKLRRLAVTATTESITASVIESHRSRRSWLAGVCFRCSAISLPTSAGPSPSGTELFARGRARAERSADLLDRGPLRVAHRAVTALAVGVGDLLGQRDDEALVLLDLVRRRLALEQPDRIADALQARLLELLGRAVARVVDVRLRRDDLVKQLAGAVVLARLGVGLGHRDRLAEGAAALRGDDDQARARGALQHDLPILRGEV